MHIEARIAAAILAAATLLAASEEPSVQERLDRQAAEIEKLRGEVRTLRAGQEGPLREEVRAYLDETSRAQADGASGGQFLGGRVRVGGYTSVLFRDDGEGKNSFFDAIRVVPKISAEIAEGLSFETEIEFEGGGADASFLSGQEILVEYAEILAEIVDDRLILKAGLILIPWGRFNLFHDDPLNDLTDRPLVSVRLGATAFDQPGAGAEGSLDLGRGWFLDYDFAVTQGFDDDITTSDGARNGRQSFRADNNENKQIWYRLVLSVPIEFLDTIELGHSGTWGKYDDANDDEVFGFAFDLFLKKGPFELAGEYMNLQFARPASAPASDPRRMDGWYVEARYHFFPRSWRGKHKLLTDESTFTLVVRIEGIDLNHATTGSTFRDDLEQISIGFNFRPVERFVFKVSYTFVDTEQPGALDADFFTVSCATFF